MTFSHSSKDPLRPPVSGGELASAMEFKHDVAEELVIGLQASDNTKNNEMMLETVSKT